MIKYFEALILIFLMGCARVQTLNLEKHFYSEKPKHIFWIQIAGFSEEHIPLLRYNIADALYRTELEKVDCVGKMYNFNLYLLRPGANESFLAQILGTKNIKSNCEDYLQRPAWDYFNELGFSSAIIEDGASESQTLEKSLSCNNQTILDFNKHRLYRMGPDIIGAKLAKPFHYQDQLSTFKENLAPGLYYDKSCQKNNCYSTLSNNVKSLWGQLVKEKSQTFFLVREFNYLRALKKKDISYAKEILQEVERILHWIKMQKREDVLIAVSGAESLGIEYPLEGKEWGEFEKNGKNIFYKNASLMSPVLATGPMSENFCGIFEESEFSKRLLSHPAKKQFSWDYINPFSN
jgi:hypothetical protein